MVNVWLAVPPAAKPPITSRRLENGVPLAIVLLPVGGRTEYWLLSADTVHVKVFSAKAPTLSVTLTVKG